MIEAMHILRIQEFLWPEQEVYSLFLVYCDSRFCSFALFLVLLVIVTVESDRREGGALS